MAQPKQPFAQTFPQPVDPYASLRMAYRSALSPVMIAHRMPVFAPLASPDLMRAHSRLACLAAAGSQQLAERTGGTATDQTAAAGPLPKMAVVSSPTWQMEKGWAQWPITFTREARKEMITHHKVCFPSLFGIID
jgi:hypothetical protein